uniref:FHA domain-containing protein n=1 Tax=Schlesneria paludicola TaxID=360056 RepID=A0A7C2K1S2_9PLAN
MYGQLLPVRGGDPIPLLKTRLVVGRRDRCDIVLDFPNVSSQHSELEFRNGYWCVRDLNSSNGTKVNGERVLEKFLQPGDTIAFAKHAFEIDYTPDPTAPPPPEEVDPFAIGLLEKAGLGGGDRGRPQRPSATNSNRPQPKPKPALPENPDDHDRALQWLMDDTPHEPDADQ